MPFSPEEIKERHRIQTLDWYHRNKEKLRERYFATSKRPRMSRLPEVERKKRRKETCCRYYLSHKEVMKARSYSWRGKNLEKVRATDREWMKNNPEKAYQKGLRRRSSHPEKVRSLYNNWAKRNWDRRLASGHKWRANRAKASGADYTTAEHIKSRWAMFGGMCWICGVPAKHTDHVKPLDKGGSHYPANLRPICPSCNSRKKNRWPIPDYVFVSAGAAIPFNRSFSTSSASW